MMHWLEGWTKDVSIVSKFDDLDRKAVDDFFRSMCVRISNGHVRVITIIVVVAIADAQAIQRLVGIMIEVFNIIAVALTLLRTGCVLDMLHAAKEIAGVVSSTSWPHGSGACAMIG